MSISKNIHTTRWACRFRRMNPIEDYKRAIELATDEDTFYVLKSFDIGPPRWAIMPASEEDFWMDSFKTRKEALALCKLMCWEVKRHISERRK